MLQGHVHPPKGVPTLGSLFSGSITDGSDSRRSGTSIVIPVRAADERWLSSNAQVAFKCSKTAKIEFWVK
jgi:hypothetical protein